MGKRLKRLPSPSMGVAFVALLAALGGTAVALPGSNTVTTGDIKKGAVKSSDVKNSSLTRSDIKNSTLRGSDVGSNTLTGSDINEGSLGTVPSANTANTASTATSAGNAGSVGGQQIVKFNFARPSSSARATIFSVGGFTLTSDCDAAGDIDLDGTTSVANSQIMIKGTNDDQTPNSDTFTDDDGASDADETVTITPLSDDEQQDSDTAFNPGDNENFQGDAYFDDTLHNLTYVSGTGTIVTAQFLVQEITNGLGTTNDCFVQGHAIVG